MNPLSVKLAYFSPTKTTRKVLEAIAQGVGSDDVEHINLTPPDSRSKNFTDFNDELVILGAPVYAGRLPEEAVRRISRLKGNNTPAVVVVLYGNREYEDALLELKDLALKLGFVPMAGGAFIGEHSYATTEFPIAEGRPNSQDLQKSMEFGKALRQKMEAMENLEYETPVAVPGDFPYKDRMPPSDECASTMEEICTACGTCAEVCAFGAREADGALDIQHCYGCGLCADVCPAGAVTMVAREK